MLSLFPSEEAETPRDEGIRLRLHSQQGVELGQGLSCAVPRSRTLLPPPPSRTHIEWMEGRTHIYLLNTHLCNDISSPCCVPKTRLEIGHRLLGPLLLGA